MIQLAGAIYNWNIESKNSGSITAASMLMTTITVPISEERLEQLRAMAERAGVPPEQLARAGLEDWLRQPREDFEQAVAHVLSKNAELYRRLA